MSNWQDISTAPKDGTLVLVWCPSIQRVYMVDWYIHNWFISYGDELMPKPTHWQPLPKPPGATDVTT